VSEQRLIINPDWEHAQFVSIAELRECENKLEEANERLRQLEEQILKAQKQKEIVNKVIEQIAQEGATSKTIEALLNQHFWGLV
jgi:Na+-translocating ferredoxin:NAD+ oxidoreductase RnfG subunit